MKRTARLYLELATVLGLLLLIIVAAPAHARAQCFAGSCQAAYYTAVAYEAPAAIQTTAQQPQAYAYTPAYLIATATTYPTAPAFGGPPRYSGPNGLPPRTIVRTAGRLLTAPAWLALAPARLAGRLLFLRR